MKWLILISVIFFILFSAYSEEEFFDDWGIRFYSDSKKTIKVSHDETHQTLVFRIVYMQDGEEIQYEAIIPLVRIWEGDVIK